MFCRQHEHFIWFSSKCFVIYTWSRVIWAIQIHRGSICNTLNLALSLNLWVSFTLVTIILHQWQHQRQKTFYLQTIESKAQYQINGILSKHSLLQKVTSHKLIHDCLPACVTSLKQMTENHLTVVQVVLQSLPLQARLISLEFIAMQSLTSNKW